MKKILIAAALLLTANVAMCQLFSYGIKAGLTSTNIKISDAKEAVVKGQNGEEFKAKLKNEAAYGMGYHVGGFARINALVMYVQPEIYFTNTNAKIKIAPNNEDGVSVKKDDKTSVIKNYRIDIPVIVGTKFGPAHVGLGPVASFNLKSDVKDMPAEYKETFGSGLENAKNAATFSMQVGAGVDVLKKLTIDVRYEFGLGKDKVTIKGQEFKTSQRANSFIASIGWMF